VERLAVQHVAHERCWLLTWTTYGTWLPGDDRGFVSDFFPRPDQRVRWNQPDTAYARDDGGLHNYAARQLRSDPVWLTRQLADPLIDQFKDTAAFRGWRLLAAAVMANHVHLVVQVLDDPDPEILLRDFKSYASRRLNGTWGKPASGTWWTQGGSKRKLEDDANVRAAVEYVRGQPFALAVWVCEASERPDAPPTG
jgi:REP element-mobilizing transposase RayT